MNLLGKLILQLVIISFLGSIYSHILVVDDPSASIEIFESFEIEEESKSDSETDTFSVDEDNDAVAHYWLTTNKSINLDAANQQIFTMSLTFKLIDRPPQV